MLAEASSLGNEQLFSEELQLIGVHTVIDLVTNTASNFLSEPMKLTIFRQSCVCGFPKSKYLTYH